MAKKKTSKVATPTLPMLLGGQTVNPSQAYTPKPSGNTFLTYNASTGAAPTTTPVDFGAPQPVKPAAPTTGGGTPPVGANNYIGIPGFFPGGNPPPKSDIGFSDAFDAFKKTFALIVGEKEASQTYLTSLFNKVYGYNKLGMNFDEAINISLRDARTDASLAPFRQRFRAVLALEDMKQAGKIVAVPTIKEYIVSEQQAADVLNRAELGTLATPDFLADVFSMGKSVNEITQIVDNVYKKIQSAPQSVKDARSALYPTMTDAQIAKAMLTGSKGVDELVRQQKGLEVVGAFNEQSYGITQGLAEELAASGQTYGTARTGAANIRAYLPRGQQLAEMQRVSGVGLDLAIKAQFKNDIEAQRQLEQIGTTESSKFKGKTGTTNVSLTGPKTF